eukprot:m.415743 g.415743  ORF g.415743 m.415743 type:complete len:589 (-) comp16825_c0_seq6:1084-2850(-)
MNGERWSPPPCAQPDGRRGAAPLPFERTSPLRAKRLGKLLERHPNRPFARYVSDVGLRGAHLGAHSFDDSKPTIRPNLPSAQDHDSPEGRALLKWLDTERKAGRLRGPWEKPPHPNFQSWPIGAIKKRSYIPIEVKARVITHYSAGKDGGLNAAIPHEAKTLQYMTIAQAVAAAAEWRAAGAHVYAFKVDLKDAFRILQVAAECLHLQGIHIRRNGKDEFYVDGHLGFGTGSGPRIFDSFASAIHWILEQRCRSGGASIRLFHLLDDFLFVAWSRVDALRAQAAKDALFIELGIPEQLEKRCSPTRRLEFLGVMVDFAQATLGLPGDKRDRLMASLAKCVEGRCLLKELESTTGLLTFAGVTIPLHRPLVSSLYAGQAIARRKGFRHVRLSAEARADAKVLRDAIGLGTELPWEALALTPYNTDLTYAVDASGADGCGGFSLDHGRMFHSPWPKGWRQGDAYMSTGLQELVAVAYLVETIPAGSSLCVWTDSMVAKGAVGKARSPVPIVNALLRRLLGACGRRRVGLVVAWHGRESSMSAIVADLCSHGRFQEAVSALPQLSAASVAPASSTVTQICTTVLSDTQPKP